jgi:hypothetical protein
VRAVPIVVVDPQRELVGEVGCRGGGNGPELFQDRSLGSLDPSVQVWRARRDRPEPYGLIHQTAPDLFGEELGARGPSARAGLRTAPPTTPDRGTPA